MDYTKICFVIMPFGEKKVGKRKVDFDAIYDAIFLPAINATKLPEGGYLEARRTDRDFFSGDISLEMFQYIEYSRFALADISALNANVFYELGVRHHAHQVGTAIFRQTDALIPFDITSIKAFPYEYEPQDNIERSKELITRVLGESLVQNRLDSPVRLALNTQQSQEIKIDPILHEAENAIRSLPQPDLTTAISKYKEALEISPENPLIHFALGMIYKRQERWDKACVEFGKATELSPKYSDAYREKGIAENKVTGETSLRKAIEINPDDFDAYACLGGVLKRRNKLEEAFEMYHRATEVSRGNPYPLLNELKLYSVINQAPVINDKYKFYLSKAERLLRAQVENVPPFDVPWSFFGLSEVYLYLNDRAGFLKILDDGILHPETLAWQIKTHRESLELLKGSKLILDGLDEGIEKLRQAEAFME